MNLFHCYSEKTWIKKSQKLILEGLGALKMVFPFIDDLIALADCCELERKLCLSIGMKARNFFYLEGSFTDLV